MSGKRKPITFTEQESSGEDKPKAKRGRAKKRVVDLDSCEEKDNLGDIKSFQKHAEALLKIGARRDSAVKYFNNQFKQNTLKDKDMELVENSDVVKNLVLVLRDKEEERTHIDALSALIFLLNHSESERCAHLFAEQAVLLPLLQKFLRSSGSKDIVDEALILVGNLANTMGATRIIADGFDLQVTKVVERYSYAEDMMKRCLWVLHCLLLHEEAASSAHIREVLACLKAALYSPVEDVVVRSLTALQALVSHERVSVTQELLALSMHGPLSQLLEITDRERVVGITLSIFEYITHDAELEEVRQIVGKKRFLPALVAVLAMRAPSRKKLVAMCQSVLVNLASRGEDIIGTLLDAGVYTAVTQRTVNNMNSDILNMACWFLCCSVESCPADQRARLLETEGLMAALSEGINFFAHDSDLFESLMEALVSLQQWQPSVDVVDQLSPRAASALWAECDLPNTAASVKALAKQLTKMRKKF